jgi:hypothetical protein
MTNDKIIIKDRIMKCYNVNGGLSFKKISKDLLLDIEKYTKFLDNCNPTTAERVYCILNDIEKVLTCPITKKS